MTRAAVEQPSITDRHINRIPLWVDDLLAMIAESGEPTLATGARLRLWLVICRRGGCIRADNSSLAKLAGLSIRQWNSVRDFILPGWDYDPETQTYSVRRIVQEIERTGNKSAKAKASAEKRWMRTHTERNANASCERSAKAMLSPSPSPSPAPSPKESLSHHSEVTPPEKSVSEVTDTNSRSGQIKTEKEELDRFITERFPEISPAAKKSIIGKGLTLQDAYRIDSLWSRLKSATAITNPGAYLYRMLESALSEAAP